jgi:gliding motility-associated-like protein
MKSQMHPLLFTCLLMLLGFLGSFITAAQATAQSNIHHSNSSFLNHSTQQEPEDETVYTLFIPNAFTPNGDGHNDEFLVSSSLLKRISMRIYDKSGEEVFATIDLTQGWNGKHYGRELKQDTYLYRIEASFMNGTDEIFVGQLNLMR